MKLKFYFIIFATLTVNICAQNLFNLKFLGFNGKVKTVTSNVYKTSSLKEISKIQHDFRRIKSFSENGNLNEEIVQIKDGDSYITFNAVYTKEEGGPSETRYNEKGEKISSIIYKKENDSVFSAVQKDNFSEKITKSTLILKNGREFSGIYKEFLNEEIVSENSYQNILNNNLIQKTISVNNGDESSISFEYSDFDLKNNPQTIILRDDKSKEIIHIQTRTFEYY